MAEENPTVVTIEHPQQLATAAKTDAVAEPTVAPVDVNTKSPSSKESVTFFVTVLLISLAIIGWIIQLGGLSAMQDSCGSGCSTQYSLEWWTCWLVLFTLLVLVLVRLFSLAEDYRNVMLGLVVLCCGLLTLATSSIVSTPSEFRTSAQKAYISGLIMIDVVFYFLITVLGSSPRSFIARLIPF
mmetsp:Transcript_15298/g.25244  ORF Transcript_15298/g.25244 Transcript_15298/m.25244 type:complete len:184 (-) Transcript_15298:480-1031(-)